MQIEAKPEHSEEARAADVVIAVLEARIASGELESDKPLPAERDLMEEFGTSRTVVREAITALANRGLVESKPRFRPVVRKPNFATLLDATGAVVRQMLNEPGGVQNIYQSRVFVEGGLVRHAALHANKDDIAQLKAALAENYEALEDTPRFFKTDMAFHEVLFTSFGNPIFPALHKGYMNWLAPNWEKMQRPPEHNLVNYQAHKSIYQAILERDPELAEQALINHLKMAWEYVKDTLEPSQIGGQ